MITVRAITLGRVVKLNTNYIVSITTADRDKPTTIIKMSTGDMYTVDGSIEDIEKRITLDKERN